MVNSYHPLGSTHSPILCFQQIVEALERLQIQTANSILGSVYVYDLVNQSNLYTNCSVASILGYTAEAIHSIKDAGLAYLIHPDDLNLVSEYYQQFTTLKFDKVITTCYRMRRSDGGWCWLRSRETPLLMAIDGFPLQILGIIQVATDVSRN